jgi:hypothetical protein
VDDTPQFIFNDPKYREERSGEISRVRRPSTHVLVSVTVGCKCGHLWRAQRAQGLDSVVGGYLVSCPSCHASESVSGRAINP